MRVRELRVARGWSQAHLAELSGLSVRTIQRIENGTHPGLESLKILGGVFGVDVVELRAQLAEPAPISMFEAIRYCLTHYAEFTGRAGRPEFWWFTLAVGLATAVAVEIGPLLATIVAALVLVPWLAAATRRIRDAGESPWWLLMLPAPVGGLVVIGVLCAMPSADERGRAPVGT